MTRILIFSPHVKRRHLTAYEGTIAKACKVRGAEVRYILCDGLLPECDEYWESSSFGRPRPFDICRHCMARAEDCMADLHLPYSWLGEYLDTSDRENAFAWAQDLKLSEICQASFMGYPLGEWVLSSVVSYFRQYPLEMDNWRVVNVYRGFLFSAALVALGLRKYLGSNQVDAAILFNGRQSTTRVAFELFRESGIRVLTHEYPFYQNGHLMLKPNARCWSPVPFEEFWRMWGKVPLTRPALEKTRDWLMNRRYGRGLSWYAFNNPYITPLAVRKELNLSKNTPLLALFTSSTEEIVGDPELQGPFESQSLWVQEVVSWVRQRSDVQLVIRVHPHLSDKTGLGKAREEFRFYEELKSSSPANVRIVMPDDSLNSYALMDEADIGLTYGSSAGIEMAMLGKPVVLGSRAFYENGVHVLTIRSRETLKGILEASLKPCSVREIRRDAFRLAYYYVFKFEVPFPLVLKRGLTDVRLNYTGSEALTPGKDETIDHACGFLMEGRPLFDPPDKEALERTTVDEDDFFEKLEHSSEPMRNREYEQWLRRSHLVNTIGRSVQGLIHSLPLGVGQAFNKIGKALYMPFLRWIGSKTERGVNSE